jgi:hypothetical protein
LAAAGIKVYLMRVLPVMMCIQAGPKLEAVEVSIRGNTLRSWKERVVHKRSGIQHHLMTAAGVTMTTIKED